MKPVTIKVMTPVPRSGCLIINITGTATPITAMHNFDDL